MKTIRPRSILQAALLFCLLYAATLLTGCSTTATGERKPLITLNPQSLENKAEAITQIAAAEVLRKNPKLRDEFQKASADLKIIADHPEFGLTELMEIVNRFPTDQLNGEESFYINAGILFFKDEFGELVVNQPEQVQWVARGMARALDKVLAK